MIVEDKTKEQDEQIMTSKEELVMKPVQAIDLIIPIAFHEFTEIVSNRVLSLMLLKKRLCT